jgi:predicted DNA-binding transcriptional regulator AlpA
MYVPMRRLIRIAEVPQICGLSRAMLYREIKAKEFPAPLKLSARSAGWLAEEVMERVARLACCAHGMAGIFPFASTVYRQL